MPTIFVQTTDGVDHPIQAEKGLSLMEAIVDHGLPMEAICGGCLSCATCHVYINPDQLNLIDPISEDEEDMLDLAEHVKKTSRLSCQLKIDDRHEGLRLSLVAE